MERRHRIFEKIPVKKNLNHNPKLYTNSSKYIKIKIVNRRKCTRNIGQQIG